MYIYIYTQFQIHVDVSLPDRSALKHTSENCLVEEINRRPKKCHSIVCQIKRRQMRELSKRKLTRPFFFQACTVGGVFDVLVLFPAMASK